jgi:Zn-finger nucleic acid-binding protein
MQCPACGNAMTEMTVGSVKVNACKGGCGGLWFDEWAFKKIEEPEQSAGEDLLNVPQNPAVKVDPEKRRKCPKDTDIVMMRHFWSVDHQVTVDECPKCAGLFLDPGKLADIRNAHENDAQRHAAAKKYFREMFDNQLAGMLKTDKAKLESARKVARVFKYIAPSYYKAGKHDWGTL